MIQQEELKKQCEKFFDEWFGPAFSPPEHLERIQERRKKSRAEFANKLSEFVKEQNTRVTPDHAEVLKMTMEKVKHAKNWFDAEIPHAQGVRKDNLKNHFYGLSEALAAINAALGEQKEE